MKSLTLIFLLFGVPHAQALPIGSIPELLKIGLRNTAKEYCSCLYVTQASEDACEDYARINQFRVRFSVNHQEKSVRSRALFDLWPFPSATAEFVSESAGCRIRN